MKKTAWLAMSMLIAGTEARRVAALQAATPRLPLYGYSIVHAYPHDPNAFTQGLEYINGTLYESTGLNGRSSIRRVNLETGEVLQKHEIAGQYFGEGITSFNADLFQLTWQSGKAFVYDRASFALKRTFTYSGEGWGLTHDHDSLIMSDGTEYLRFLDPATFEERRRLRVTGVGQPVNYLNELEYVNGEIFANVWMTDYIARVNPLSGQVAAYIDLHGLLPPQETSPNAVLNGIAYDAKRDRLFVTGKLWPKLFEIKLIKKA